MLQRLCTPAGEDSDMALLSDVVSKVAVVVVGGALLKTAHYMKENSLPGINIIMRDQSHIIRASRRAPPCTTRMSSSSSTSASSGNDMLS